MVGKIFISYRRGHDAGHTQALYQRLGRAISSRLASATLSAIGLTDFIGRDLDGYVDLAVAKTADLAALAWLRGTLRGRIEGSAFGDPSQYCRAVEAAYSEMWQGWCAAHSSTPARR